MNAARASHPERLPWFADGRLDPAESSAVEAHLLTCSACRAEVDALRSLFRNMRASIPLEHIALERLVAYHAGGAELPTCERGSIERHVRGCHACAADLEALERAVSRGPTLRTGRLLATAASVLVVVVAGWRLEVWRSQPAPAPAVARVVFPPAQRGASPSIRLEGHGPWLLEVWAPPRGATDYVARVERSGAPSEIVFQSNTASTSGDGKVLVLVPGILQPGHHVLSLIPKDGHDTEIYARGFDVVSPP